MAPPSAVPIRSSIRTRALWWILLVLTPLAVASAITVRLVDDELTERVVNDLGDIRRLEVARIDQVLDAYEREAVGLSGGVHVRSFVAGVVAARAGADTGPIGGIDGFDPVDPAAAAPLDQLASAVLAKTSTAGGAALGVTIVAPDGESLGSGGVGSRAPVDPVLVAGAVASGTGAFGPAFRADDGDRLTYVQPITDEGRVVGALVLELDLARVTAFVTNHEGIGDTSEAHLAQRTADGDAEFITLLRFERDAAFTTVVPTEADKPINWALEAVPGRTVQAEDYRGVPSFLSIEAVPRTGWGLVVKIDRSEALAGASRIRNLIVAAGAAVALAVMAMWAGFLRPLTRRIREVSESAANVVGAVGSVPGEDEPDEIGELARTIKRLSSVLDDDERLRREYEAELYRRATHDELTGLVNRRHATSIVEELMAHDDEAPSSLLFADLDGFKVVNDSYGHLVGDEILRYVAARLGGAVPDGATVARWGGDEFVVVLPGHDEAAARAVLDDIRAAVAGPVTTTVGELPLRCSLGCSTTRPGRTLDELLRDADHAMFVEKSARNGRRDVDTATLRNLERALTDDRIEVHFQPIVEVTRGGAHRLVAAEALVRMRTEDGVILQPAEFLTAAQDNHLGRDLDWHVAQLAIRSFGAWSTAGSLDDHVGLALNLCEASTLWDELPSRLDGELREVGVPADRLTVEISARTEHVDDAVLAGLRSLDVAIVVDDLGTGYSGMARLAELRPYAAKIDRGWTEHAGSDAASEIVARMAEMCGLFGVRVAAEGVETDEQLAEVLAAGIDVIQGYLFDRPLPPERFAERWLRRPDEPVATASSRVAGGAAAG